MTVIMPMGEQKVGWEPGKKQTVKVASKGSSEQEVVIDGSDALYKAAKAHLDKEAQLEVVEIDEAPEEVLDVVEDVVNEVSEEEASDVAEEAVEDVAEESEKGAAGEIEIAVEKIEEAVEDVKDAVTELADAETMEDDAEIEVEVELEDLGEEVCCEDDSAIPDGECDDPECPKKDGEEDIVIESDEICESCGTAMASCGCDKAIKEASSDEEYVRYSKVSPKNQRLIRNYWKSDLGYDPDYVALMTKNYEK